MFVDGEITIPYFLHDVLADSAAVFNGDDQVIVVYFHADIEQAASISIFDGIADKIGKNLINTCLLYTSPKEHGHAERGLRYPAERGGIYRTPVHYLRTVGQRLSHNYREGLSS